MAIRERTGGNICHAAGGGGGEEVRLWREVRASPTGGLHGMLGLLILTFWAIEGLLSNSEQRSDVISFGILFW